MGVTVDGLVSGLDTTAIIEAYVAVAGASTDTLRAQQSDLETRRSLLQSFNSLLEDVQSSVSDYTEASDLRLVAANTTNEEVLTVSAENGAQPGTYSIDVVQLAQAEIEVSDGFASKTTDVFTGGSIDITVAGASPATQVDISEANGTTSLTGLASYINENVDGVQAYILDDGTETAPYRLVVVSEDTGSTQTVEIDTSALQGASLSFTEQISAQDAQITIAGLDVYSESNAFADVIPGLTFTAQSEGSAVVTASQDTDAVVEAVQGFVDAYNGAMSFISAYTGLDANNNSSALSGEAVLRSVQTALQGVMRGAYESGDLMGASSLGFATQQDGALELDTDKLIGVLNGAPADVMEILAGADGIFQALEGRCDLILDPDTGTIALRTESIDDQIEAFEEQIEADEARLEIYEDSLRQQFTYLEMTLSELQSLSSYVTQLFASTLSSGSGSG